MKGSFVYMKGSFMYGKGNGQLHEAHTCIICKPHCAAWNKHVIVSPQIMLMCSSLPLRKPNFSLSEHFLKYVIGIRVFELET